ncbi:hypothetical protein COEREDRAFT_7012 [Coemansia reversa NRRL 1564]|uniref:PI31 proteasome regulator C-terminal domain-containing protein n=1 Tax=Coemansia reversa (strain ATCC 12441 / NRRL 1564) TaxID=763665 RepID=A0A2G5BFL1_COERN|nr:hypothetical protein COEREDRAFT_7012 [Coemansia reversa NRRL 1564]|eukprot:PIA17818.1 hypothetical protein COEREDRAFT_7012 [Coemansia reversa NRRL 1564]
METNNTTEEAVRTRLVNVVGNSPLHSSEDLVVALSLATLFHLGFELRDATAAWISPGLPQGQHLARLVYTNDNNREIEAKWVSMGPNVVLLVRALEATPSDIQLIQLPVSRIVAPDVEFPYTVTVQSLDAAILPNAVATVTAAIREKLINDTAPAQEPPLRVPGTPSDRATSSQQSQQAPSIDYNSPLRDSRYSGSHLRVGPTSVGGDDLNPMGLTRGDFGEGSMLVGPEHPMFTQGGERSRDDDSALSGGPPLLPRDAVPPGARFDPIVPPGAMPPGLGRGRGSGRGGGAGGNRFFSGGPDPDAGGPPDSSWNYM